MYKKIQFFKFSKYNFNSVIRRGKRNTTSTTFEDMKSNKDEDDPANNNIDDVNTKKIDDEDILICKVSGDDRNTNNEKNSKDNKKQNKPAIKESRINKYFYDNIKKFDGRLN